MLIILYFLLDKIALFIDATIKTFYYEKNNLQNKNFQKYIKR